MISNIEFIEYEWNHNDPPILGWRQHRNIFLEAQLEIIFWILIDRTIGIQIFTRHESIVQHQILDTI